MKTLINLICIVVLALSLNSCATFKISTIGHETVEEITIVNQLRWEIQTDWRYWRYRPYRPYSWHNPYQFNNIMWQYGYNTSQWSFYNRRDLWWNWYSPWQLNVYNNWNGYSWNSWDYTPPYAYGRRGSRGRSNSTIYFQNRRSNRSNRIVDLNGSTSDSRTYLQTLRNLSNANRSIQKTKTHRSRQEFQPQRPLNQPRVIRSNRAPINTNTQRPRINNSSSRPNSTRPVRPSVRKTTTTSSRKIKRNN